MKPQFRVEKDSMGPVNVPAGARYGAQTARAVENFPISGIPLPRPFIRALGLIKKHAAITNASLGLLPARMARAIATAANEVSEGTWDAHFPVDVFQTGSGTSSNMNANEVISNRASELLGGRPGRNVVHPNDHVNLGQSSNDVIPTALHVAAATELRHSLATALHSLRRALAGRSRAFRGVIKAGRTHLQDATPMRLGDEFSGYASQVAQGIERIRRVETQLLELALGGTAIGTGLNAKPGFARRVIARLARETRIPFVEAANHFEAQASRDACVDASGALKSIAVGLSKIANDIRLLGSGPWCGLGELKLPPTQPGSSIMPGKVNPVMCEMVLQVSGQVVGNDAAITWGGAFGNLELNTMLPLIAHNLLQSIHLLTTASRVFADRCIRGLTADRERCRRYAEHSLSLGTALAPLLGYDRVAEITRLAQESGRSVYDVALEQTGIPEPELKRLLDPANQAS